MFDSANQFLTNDCLLRSKLTAFIPSSKIQRIGVIRDIDVDIADHELVTHLKADYPIIRTSRIMRVTKAPSGDLIKTPTQAVKIVFAGQYLPTRAFLFYTSVIVDPYIFPVIQCRKCLRFGHVADQCKGKLTCAKCAQNHAMNTCEQITLCCVNCKSDLHLATDRGCSQYKRQRQIKEIMANENVPFHEVFIRYPELNDNKKSRNKFNNSSSHFPVLKKSTVTQVPHLTAPSVPRAHLRSPSPVASNVVALKRPRLQNDTSIVLHSSITSQHKHGFDRTLYNSALLSPHGRNVETRSPRHKSIPVRKACGAKSDQAQTFNPSPDTPMQQEAINQAVDT